MFTLELVGSMIGVLAYQCVGVALFVPFEMAFPRMRITLAERMHGFIFLIAAAPVAGLLAAILATIKTALGIQPLITFHSSLGAPILASIVLALWVDLQFYVVHRLEHRLFWRFHAVHHSIRRLSAANSYHHWTEPLWGALVLGIPLIFVNLEIAPVFGLLTFLFTFQQFYIHSSSRPHFGPLRWLLVDNRYHRIHHSTDPNHHDKNFGAMTPLWDWLFGTLYMPAKDEWPDVGLDQIGEPRDLREWSSLPWRLSHRKKLRLECGPGQLTLEQLAER